MQERLTGTVFRSATRKFVYFPSLKRAFRCGALPIVTEVETSNRLQRPTANFEAIDFEDSRSRFLGEFWLQKRTLSSKLQVVGRDVSNFASHEPAKNRKPICFFSSRFMTRSSYPLNLPVHRAPIYFRTFSTTPSTGYETTRRWFASTPALFSESSHDPGPKTRNPMEGLPVKPYPPPPEILTSLYADSKAHLRLRRIRISHNHLRSIRDAKNKDLGLIFRFLEELAFYWHGLRLYFLDARISMYCLADCLRKLELKSYDKQQLRRNGIDSLRLIPFLALLLAPAAAIVLPAAVKLFPAMLPSTFNELYEPDQAADELKIYVSRYYAELQEFAKLFSLTDDVLDVLNSATDDDYESVANAADALIGFMLRNGMTLYPQLLRIHESLQHVKSSRDHLYDN